MQQKWVISILIVSIGVKCSAWSEPEKFKSKSHSVTNIEDRIPNRESQSDQLKITSRPLQIRDDKDPDVDSKGQKKNWTPFLQPIDNKDMFPGCCGQRYGVNYTTHTETDIRKSGSTDGERDKNLRYGNLQDNRYSWQTSNYPLGGDNDERYGTNNGAVTKSPATPDRFQRPPYGNEHNDNDKSSLNFGGGLGGGSGIGAKFGGFDYKFGGLGTSKFGVSGDKFNVLGNRFGVLNYGDGEYGRPGGYRPGPYGENFEYGNHESGFGEGGLGTSNLATQQAVALKALAGVALIGAAAALATNPLLLPIGVMTGRRKRDLQGQLSKDEMSTTTIIPLTVLRNYVSKSSYENQNHGGKTGQQVSISPYCVARLTCEVQKDYITDLRKHQNILKRDQNTFHGLERWFMNLIEKNIFEADYVDKRMKELIKLAIDVGSEGRNCAMFSCNLLGS